MDKFFENFIIDDVEAYHEESLENGSVSIINYENELVYDFYNTKSGYCGLSFALPSGISYYIVEFEVLKSSIDSGKLGVINVVYSGDGNQIDFSREYVNVGQEWITFKKAFKVNPFSNAQKKLYIENEGPNTHHYYLKNIRIYPLNNVASIQDISLNYRKLGNSNHRPTNIRKGGSFFDTTLNKPIWWTGIKWVDATGADV